MGDITIKKLDEWQCCSREDGEDYSDENLTRLFGGKDSLIALEVLSKPIPAEHRIWAVLRPEVIGEGLYKRFGRICADRVVNKYVLNCGILELERWASNWLNGTDRSEKAIEKAINVARNVDSFASKAVWASWVAWDTTWVADFSAKADDSSDAEREWQVEKLKKLLRRTRSI